MAPKSSGRRRRSRGGDHKVLHLWAPVAIITLLILYALALNYSRPHVEGRELRFDQFFSLAQDERIETATILNFDSFVVGTYERPDGTVADYYTPFLKMGEFSGGASQGFLIDLLLQYEIPFEIDQQYEKNLIGPATLLLPALIIIVVFIYLALSWHRGTGLFAVRSGAKKHERGATATFDDIAGQQQAVSQVRELARFLSDPEDFEAVGAKIPRGVLLYGPPGCGKTLLARALAGEAGASFYSISGSDFVELYVGVGASRVRDLFKEARENAPAIIFIDELDSIGRRRGGGAGPVGSGSREEQEQALNQILAEMDGFSPAEGVLLIGATNRPDILDPALLRPGRFDRAIGLERPDEQGREAILEVHAKGKPLDAGVSLRAIAARGVGLTGADLANVINEAALEAARAGRRRITQDDLERGLSEILEAPERQRRLSMRDRSIGARSLTEDRVTFDDVAGVDEAKVELAEVKQFLDDPDRYVRMGARFPRGLLLVGPPGCGKTLLARAVANEANAAFISASATEFVEVFVGEGPARVRDLFAQARSVPPAIIFIDEIDAIGARREASMDGHREREQTLNQILIELDGFSPRSGVLVIAASNRPEILDPALVRPGRFDRTITLDVPDRAGRRAILDVHARDKPLASDVDLDAVAGVTRGLSGAELANVMNEAALLATRKNLDSITMSVMDEAIERVALGVARSHILSENERKVIAFHEAGHALVALSLDEEKIPHKVTIVPRGRFLGGSWNIDPHDRVVHSRTSLINEMAIALGGRAAEELVFGEPGSAAADDLSRVGRTARQMVLDLGMSERLGWLAYSSNGHPTTHSEETAQAIDDEVRKVVGEARSRATQVLTAERSKLERIAAALMEKETLSAEEIARLAV